MQTLLHESLASETNLAFLLKRRPVFGLYVTLNTHCIYYHNYYTVAEALCETGEVRLFGGEANTYSGIVEVCVEGVWGTICDIQGDWGIENAAIVCHQLGFAATSK